MGELMTEKDYILIAKVINETINENPMYHPTRIVFHDLVDRLAKELKQDNIRFEKDKFIRAVFGD
jgi:hypothetical protein